jgi:hypothetical protein
VLNEHPSHQFGVVLDGLNKMANDHFNLVIVQGYAGLP